jgi:hypothetical protein
LATDEFDIKEIKNKEPQTVLKAMQKCFTRKYVKEPKYSLKTDSGTEFKGIFHKWLYDESILHKVAPAHRHASMGNIESLNNQLGRLFMGYMISVEERTGKPCKNWTDIVPIVREKLNAVRKKSVPDDINSYEYAVPEDLKEVLAPIKSKKSKEIVYEKQYEQIKPKFKVGRYVYFYLDHPKDALGKNQNTAARRQGDYNWSRVPHRIEQIFTYGGIGPTFRYYLEGLPIVSYTEQQLKPAVNPNN